MVRKPAKRGYKHFLLVDATNGMIFNEFLYMGKDDSLPHIGLQELILVELLKPFRHLKNATLYFDRGISSFNLTEYLFTCGFETISTLNERSICVPDQLKLYKNCALPISIHCGFVKLIFFSENNKNIYILTSSTREANIVYCPNKLEKLITKQKEISVKLDQKFETNVVDLMKSKGKFNIFFIPLKSYVEDPKRTTSEYFEKRRSSSYLSLNSVDQHQSQQPITLPPFQSLNTLNTTNSSNGLTSIATLNPITQTNSFCQCSPLAKNQSIGANNSLNINVNTTQLPNSNTIEISSEIKEKQPKHSHVLLYNQFMGGVDYIDRNIANFNVQTITNNPKFALFTNFMNYCLNNICMTAKMIFDDMNDNQRKKEGLNSVITCNDIIRLLIDSVKENHLQISHQSQVDLVYEMYCNKQKSVCEICSSVFNVERKFKGKDVRTSLCCFKCHRSCCVNHSIPLRICYSCAGLSSEIEFKQLHDKINEKK